MHNRVDVGFQGQIETVLKESLADLDIKVKKIFQQTSYPEPSHGCRDSQI